MTDWNPWIARSGAMTDWNPWIARSGAMTDWNPWIARAVALALSALVVGCGGSEGAECRSSSECRAPLECAGPSEPNVCGIPGNVQCSGDQDCFGMLCHAVPDVCSPDGVGSECRQPCSDGQCGDGFRCGASGACEAVPCDEGYACPIYQACDPSIPNGTGPVQDRTQGCVAISCSADGDCPATTACVNRVCQAGPGQCVEVQIVP